MDKQITPEEFDQFIDQMKRKDVKDIDPILWQGMIQNALNWYSYSANMGLINQITAEMKEIPVIASEVPAEDDHHPLIKVEFSPDGGLLTYMQGYDYPYKGFPLGDFVDRMDIIKKVARQVQSAVYHSWKGKRWRMILMLPLIPSFRQIFYAYAYSFYRIIERVRLKPNRYCKAVKEIYRAASIETEGEIEQIKELRNMLRDFECMLLEFDNAYRYRVQDLLVDMNKEVLQKRPIKEINRLLDIWISREQTVEIKDSWRLLKMFVTWYLRFDRKLLKMIVNVLLNINVEEIKLTVEDTYFAKDRKDYKFPLRIPRPTVN